MTRTLLTSFFCVFFSFFVAACGAPDPALTASDEEGATEEMKPSPTGRFVRFYNWNNYIADTTVERFEKKCNCRMVQDYFSDHEEMLAKLAAGATGYDVMVPTGNVVETLMAQKMIQPIDKSRLKNLDQVKPEFLDMWFDSGNQYSVPYGYSITLIGYNAEKIKELDLPVDSWALIFEPELLKKLKGKITVMDSQRELFAAALLYLGYSVNDSDEAHLKEARDLILRAKPYWAAFNASSYIKELTIGNIWVAHGYSNDMFQADQDAKAAGRPFTIASSLPKEGAVLAVDNMVIHKSAPHLDLAYQLIDFLIDKQSTAELSNLTGSGSINELSLEYIEQDIKENKAVFPDAETFERLQMLKDYPRKERRLANRLWTEIKVK
ncbi:MAG: spermidine/putrescine ABC transporter substrate-binding protein [Proteobacteria bacterium]|nr:spermidine/putrescine ABC transporter substrate-binding protein [Pseudomonadota bacterium]MCL2306633.1 spermidine/putrescine ABC transporter substrate-binding protein [Pseudomonadota bacterium]